MEKSLELLIEIKSTMAGMEQHLKDMNGRLIKHDEFLSKECPRKHTAIDKRTAKTGVILMIIGVLGVTILNIVLPKLFGG